jgi:hypothetical protein
MTDKQREDETRDLEEQEATELPERDNMSLVNANLAVPINAALAANVLSDGAQAGAGAHQTAPIGQDMLGGATTPTAPAPTDNTLPTVP